MMKRRKISEELQQSIREQAQYLCEYCHASEFWQYVQFTVDHIIPLSQGGTENRANLCLACFHCNRRKGSQIDGIDPVTRQKVSLFHPRHHRWNEHFTWSSDKLLIIGLTPIGRATVLALGLNRERTTRIRAADIVIGRHPPLNDSIQLS